MDKEKLITDITKLALDFWTVNLHNGTFESNLRTLIDKYDVAITVAHSSLKLEGKEKTDFDVWKNLNIENDSLTNDYYHKKLGWLNYEEMMQLYNEEK